MDTLEYHLLLQAFSTGCNPKMGCRSSRNKNDVNIGQQNIVNRYIFKKARYSILIKGLMLLPLLLHFIRNTVL